MVTLGILTAFGVAAAATGTIAKGPDPSGAGHPYNEDGGTTSERKRLGGWLSDLGVWWPRLVLIVAAVALTWSGAAAKGNDPGEQGSAYDEKGYKKDSAYAIVDGPAVNAFNFNFTFELPFDIGLNYPENAGVSLQLKLTYNSRMWYWRNTDFHRKFIRVRRQNPFGLGFDITLGRIISTDGNGTSSAYTYVDSSGAQHKLYQLATGSSEYRSHDGSHLRAVYTSAGDYWTVSFSNGLVQELHHHVTGPVIADLTDAYSPCNTSNPDTWTYPPSAPICPFYGATVPDPAGGWQGFDRDYVGWHVTSVYTRASTSGSSSPSYTVDYYGDNNDGWPQYAHVIKDITDQFQRQIHFALNTSTGRVDSVVVPAPADETGASRTATYQLVYSTWQRSGISQPVLAKLIGPDVGNSQNYTHVFGYDLGGESGTGVDSNLGGQMNSITYPSGRVVNLVYTEYPFLNGSQGYCNGTGGSSDDFDFCNGDTHGGSCAHTWGVNEVDTYLDGTKSNLVCTPANLCEKATFSQTHVDYLYYSTGFDCSVAPAGQSTSGYTRYDQVHTMVDPAGNKTEFQYRTSKEQADQNMHGLLISQTYYGGGGPGTTVRTKKSVQYGPVQSCSPCGSYVQLDSGASGDAHPDYEMAQQQIVTTWQDDESESGGALAYPTLEIEARSNFDGFGHYQRSQLSGTAVGDESKVVIKDYAADNTTYSGGPLCANASTLQANWLGDVVAREETHKLVGGTETTLTRSDYGYDTVRGFRTEEVRRSDVGSSLDPCTNAPSGNPGDYATDFGFTSTGDLQSEHLYIVGPPSNSAPNDVTARFTYSYGARDSGKNDGLSYYDWVRVIDHDSGLPTAQRDHPTSPTDTSAVTTTFAYDVIGRTTKITHGQDWPLVIAYENVPSAVSPSPAVTLAGIRSTQGSGDVQTESVDYYQYGRPEHSEKLNPDGSSAYSYTQYNSAGRVSFVTEWTRQESGAGVPGTTTDYAVYDANGNYLFEEPFGRPSTVTDALGNVTKYHYFGLNKETTVKNVALKATALDDPADVKTRYYTDALDRLRIVSAPVVVSPGAGHGPYEQTGAGGVYAFDVLGRMLQGDISGTVTVLPTATNRYNASASSPQSRFATFDNLGRQVTATNPESGTMTNQSWNVLGQVTQTLDANGATHSTIYDSAGRATKFQRGVPSDPPTGTGTTWQPGDGQWTKILFQYDSAGTCFGAQAWTYDDISNGTCSYATPHNKSGAGYIESQSMSLASDAVLTFKLYREVRADDVGATPRDILSVLVVDGSGGTTEVYRLDSTQVSWPKWVQTATIPIGKYFAGQSKKIRIQFDPTGTNTSTALRGIGIGAITVRTLAGATMRTVAYDESFGIPTNHPLGKPTTLVEYDDATLGAQFTREMHYTDVNGRVSDEKLTFDWDRDGVNQTLVDEFIYDGRGDLGSERFPYAPSTANRKYYFTRQHGALVGIYSIDTSNTSQQILPTFTSPGIEYNDAGGMSVVRYQNGLQQHISSNAEFLPSRMWVDRGSGTPLFDTGSYVYDGGRNIKQIGSDYYRYDAANRLTWSRVTSNLYGTVDLDQVYDVFGNMTAQTASFPNGGSPTLPNGLTFSGRTYQVGAGVPNNRISNTGFAFDSDGNLTDEPAHDGLLAQSYLYTSDSHLAHVTNGASIWTENALYEGDDHRWFRSLWSDGGKALVTVRDAFGQVASDYLESNATSGLKLQKEYIRANGQLVAVDSTCGPRPALALSTPAFDGTNVWFDRTDYVAPLANSNFTIYINTTDGQSKSMLKPSSIGTHFSLLQTDLFPNVTNFIQIETAAACGHTGYSNAVSYSYSTLTPQNGGSCLSSIGASRWGFTGTGSNLTVGAQGNCPTGTTYNFYYQAVGASSGTLLNPGQPLSVQSILIANVPCGAAEGNYWTTPVIGGIEGTSTLQVNIGGPSCGGGGGGTPGPEPGQPTMNAQYVSWDHLGSTRLVTDEDGVTIDAFKYYPFGIEAETSGADVRQKFTGHERDDATGLDYMMARSCRMALTRFLTPDPYDESAQPDSPQSWNRYAYVSNNPIGAVDPTGYDAATVGNVRTDTNKEPNPAGEPGQPDNRIKDGAAGAVAPTPAASNAQVDNAQVGKTTVGALAKTMTNEIGSLSGGAPGELDKGKTAVANAIINNAELPKPGLVAPATGTAASQDAQIMRSAYTNRANGGPDPVQGRTQFGTSHNGKLKSRDASNHMKGAAGRETVFQRFGPFKDSVSRRPTYIYIYNNPGH